MPRRVAAMTSKDSEKQNSDHEEPRAISVSPPEEPGVNRRGRVRIKNYRKKAAFEERTGCCAMLIHIREADTINTRWRTASNRPPDKSRYINQHWSPLFLALFEQPFVQGSYCRIQSIYKFVNNSRPRLLELP